MSSRITDERVSEIVSQVRTNLDKVSEVDLKTRQIYAKANRVQTDIMLKTKCVEQELTINIKKNIGDYDILADKPAYLKSYETSWKGKLYYKEMSDLVALSYVPAFAPLYISLFAGKLRVRPIMTEDYGWIKFYYYQNSVINKMDNDVPPETPDYADTCLIMGICAQFSPKEYMGEYLTLLKDIERTTHIKHGFPRTPTDNYVWSH